MTVADTVAADILTGRLAPGDMLPPEPHLCLHFGVSRTVVREAVAGLVRQGLTSVHHGIGTVVCDRAAWNDLDPELLSLRATLGLIHDLMDDLLEIRRMVEVEVAGLAARRRSPQHVADLGDLVQQMERAVGDLAAYSAADIDFHEALILASGNELVRKMMRPVNQVRRIGSDLIVAGSSRSLDVYRSSMDGHRAILAAVEASDPDAARDAMARHIRQFELNLADIFPRPGTAAA